MNGDKAAGEPAVDLGDGVRMPMLGLGVWKIPDGKETEQAVEWALEAGYRHIDTATLYRNERGVGAALRRSGIPREQLFVTTKWLPMQRENPRRALARSLERLGLDHVDLYLVHWPLPLRTTLAWRSFAGLRDDGLARSVGVSNYGRDRLERMRGLRPAVNQVRFGPLHYKAALLEYCTAHGIVLEAYTPLEHGAAFTNPVIVETAHQLERTPAQVMLRWAIQHGVPVIPKSVRRERIVENAAIFDFELDPGQMLALDALGRS